MISIDIKEILDFLYCPMIVKYKRLGIITRYKNIKDKYEEDMKKFSYAYHLMQSHNGISIRDAKGIFAGLWLSNKTDDYRYVDSGDLRNTQEFLRKKGIDSLIAFHERASTTAYFPIIFNYKYKVPVGTTIVLCGTIDLISQVGTSVELTCYKGLSQLYRKESLYNDLETVAMRYAFEYIFSIRPDKTTTYMLDTAKAYSCTQHNITILLDTIKAVAFAIENDMYYRASYDRCYKCIYNQECGNHCTN